MADIKQSTNSKGQRALYKHLISTNEKVANTIKEFRKNNRKPRRGGKNA